MSRVFFIGRPCSAWKRQPLLFRGAALGHGLFVVISHAPPHSQTHTHTHRQVAECSAEVVRVMLGGAPSKLAGEYSLQLHPKLSASLKATEAAVLPYWCAGVSLLWTPTAPLTLSAAVINKMQLGMDICCLSHRTPQSCTLPCCS